MLVLSRRVGETILIDGGRIRVQVVDVAGETVRLGIDAARDIVVLREEIAQTEAANREAAAAPTPDQLLALKTPSPLPPTQSE